MARKGLWMPVIASLILTLILMAGQGTCSHPDPAEREEEVRVEVERDTESSISAPIIVVVFLLVVGGGLLIFDYLKLEVVEGGGEKERYKIFAEVNDEEVVRTIKGYFRGEVLDESGGVLTETIGKVSELVGSTMTAMNKSCYSNGCCFDLEECEDVKKELIKGSVRLYYITGDVHREAVREMSSSNAVRALGASRGCGKEVCSGKGYDARGVFDAVCEYLATEKLEKRYVAEDAIVTFLRGCV